MAGNERAMTQFHSPDVTKCFIIIYDITYRMGDELFAGDT